MKEKVKICLKTLVAAAAVLFMGTPMCLSTGEACVQAGHTMLAAMFLMTFPTGVFFFLIALIFVDPGRDLSAFRIHPGLVHHDVRRFIAVVPHSQTFLKDPG